jgi:hypothetical protein
MVCEGDGDEGAVSDGVVVGNDSGNGDTVVDGSLRGEGRVSVTGAGVEDDVVMAGYGLET